ncbi:hypothetical protein BC941DRAFT_475994 [Chlamydoabsidia padenii]|nr:hypothetical protein BC941DRAFT_475994 [Chlamydoabsidia padenii]
MAMPEQLRFDDVSSYKDYIVSLREGEWILLVICNDYNHQLDTLLSGHPSVRRLNATNRQTLAVMSASGSQLQDVISSIRRADPSAELTARTIYNERYKNMQIELDGRTPIRALIDELSTSDKYVFDLRGFCRRILIVNFDNLTPKLRCVVCCPVCNIFRRRRVHASRNIRSLALFSVLGFMPSVLTHNHAAADFPSDSPAPASDNNPLLTTSGL